MNKIQLELSNTTTIKASQGQSKSTPADSSDIKDLASSLRGELQSLKSNRETIIASLTSRSQKESSSGIDEADKFRNLRKQVKEMQKQGEVNPEELDLLKQDYTELMDAQEGMDKPYLRPFVAFMDKQIQELEAKLVFTFTPEQVFSMNETSNQALSALDQAGSALNLDNLDESALSDMSKTVSKMRSDFSRHTLKLYPEMGEAYSQIDKDVSQAVDPEKAKLDFGLAMKPTEIANQMVAVNELESKGEVAAATEVKIGLKDNMVDYYDRVSNLDEGLKQRTIASTDAD